MNSIKKYLQELKRHHIVVLEAYLFGSHVSGQPHPYSDIDLAVVCQPFDRDEIEQNMTLWRLTVHVDPRLAPIRLSPQDLLKEHIPIIPEIKKGLPIDCPAA